MSQGDGPLKWEGRLEEAFLEAVKAAGGAQQARPKQVLDALAAAFPELNLRVDQVKWHLQAHRRREDRAAEWLAAPEGPVRWTGKLKDAFDEVVERLGGVAQAQPKAVWEALSPQYPMLTVQSCKWHIQTLRKRRARDGSPGVSAAGEEDSDPPAADRNAGAPMAGLAAPRALQQQQGTALSAGDGGGGSSGMLPESSGSQLAQRRVLQAKRPPAWPRPWAGHTLQAAEWQLRRARYLKERARELVGGLERQAAVLSETLDAIASGREAGQQGGAAALLDMPAFQYVGALHVRPSHSGSALPAAAGAAGAGKPLFGGLGAAVLLPDLDAQQRAAGSWAEDEHDPATCTLPRCRRCAYAARLLLAEAEQAAQQQQQAAAAQQAVPPQQAAQPQQAGSGPLPLAAQQQAGSGPLQLGSRDLDTTSDLKMAPGSSDEQQQPQAQQGQQPQQPQQPADPQQQQQQQQQQQRRLREQPAAASAALPQRSSNSTRASAGGPQAADEAALELQASHPGLDIRVCAAICRTLPAAAGAAATGAMAAWLLDAGVRTPSDVVTLLDGSSQFVELAVQATKAQGIRLMQWAALLAACKGPL